MKRLLAPAILLLAAPLFAEPALVDPRLSDAEEFGRYADVSRARSGEVASPGWDPAPRRQAAARLAPFAAGPAPARPSVPSVLVPPSEGTDSGRRVPTAGLVGLAILGAGAAVLLIAASAPRRRSPETEPTQAPVGEVVETLPDIRYYAPPPPSSIVVGPPPRPPAPARPEPPAVSFKPELRQSWLAITAEEQRAIDAWDRSFEKELGLASLDAWLDSHAAEFPRLDVSLLKAKLDRGA